MNTQFKQTIDNLFDSISYSELKSSLIKAGMKPEDFKPVRKRCPCVDCTGDCTCDLDCKTCGKNRCKLRVHKSTLVCSDVELASELRNKVTLMSE